MQLGTDKLATAHLSISLITFLRRAIKTKSPLKEQICLSFFRGEWSRCDRLTFYEVNINSGPKIPKGNFGVEQMFTKQKVKKLGGGRGQEKVRKIFTFLVLMARLT